MDENEISLPQISVDELLKLKDSRCTALVYSEKAETANEKANSAALIAKLAQADFNLMCAKLFAIHGMKEDEAKLDYNIGNFISKTKESK